jgi:TPR repeat protein
MRYGRRKTREKVVWLVKFLQEWCDGNEIENRVKKHVEALRNGEVKGKGAVYLTEAYAALIEDYNLQHQLISETRAVCGIQEKTAIAQMSQSDKELLESAQKAIKKENYKKAKKELNKIQHHQGTSYFYLGLVSLKLEEFDNAIKYYKIAIEHNNEYAANNLGDLYETKLNDYDNAIKYYLIAIDNGSRNANNNIAYFYYRTHLDKRASIEYSAKAIETERNYASCLTHAKALLWNDYFVESIQYFEEFRIAIAYEDENVQEYALDFVIDYFILLLAKKQYHLAYNLFHKHPELMDQYKPIYYALMKFLQDKYPREYLKMGSELEETVEEILVKVEEKRKDYC